MDTRMQYCWAETVKKINPLKPKYFDYYMDLAIKTAEQSVSKKRKVGAVIVLPSGLLTAGWNGTPSGFDNECEYTQQHTSSVSELKTKPEVIHAERNALDKLARQGVSPEGGIIFTTCDPCIECAKSIASVGVQEVYYLEQLSNHSGINYLLNAGLEVRKLIQQE